MPCQRIVALLAGLGLTICKRQGVGLLTAKLDSFRAEDEAVLRAGLADASFVTVDDTGARHAGKGCFTTHIGSDRFAAFRTGPGKSRLAFLSPIARRRGALCDQCRRDRLYARRQSAAGRRRPARRSCCAGLWLARGMDGSFARARPCRLAGHARSGARGQRSGAVGRDRGRRPARGRGRRFRRRRPVPRRRPRAVLSSTPSASSTSSSPPTTDSATPSRSPSG
jgi:hypothetical protein